MRSRKKSHLTRRRLVQGAALALPAVSLSGALAQARAQRVLIVGAGAAGLTAAFHLKGAGAEVQILEAAPLWGGRVARLQGLADFPIDIGAEWIHTDPTVLGEMIGAGETDLGVSTIRYKPRTYQLLTDSGVHNRNFISNFYEEVKFETTTWYGFFERFVAPSVADDIIYNAAAQQVDLSGSGVRVKTRDGRTFEADQLIMAVPLSQHQNRSITYAPALPARVFEGADAMNFGEGFKVFMKFRERFYPDMMFNQSIRQLLFSDGWDSKIYYDAAFGKPVQDNVLALFNVAQTKLPMASLSDAALLEAALDELTSFYGSVVRQSFERAVVQNWSQRDFISGSYSMDLDADPEEVFAPVAGKLFFAGEMLGGDSQSTVHGAAFSGIAAVEAALSA